MKKIITTLALALFTGALAFADTTEPDSMYVHFTSSQGADSIVVHTIEKVDSIVFYAPTTSSGGTSLSGTFTDSRDNHEYKWVKIGTQVWMAENLQCASGTYIEDNDTWADLDNNDTDAAYCYYNNDADGEKATYGALYTYAAALNACPAGWHLPSDAEWKTLEMALGMSQSEADDTGWRGTDEGSQLAGNSSLWNDGDLKDNSEFGTSGFLALPGGYRNDDSSGTFSNQGYKGGGWGSSAEDDGSGAYGRGLHYSFSTVYRNYFSKSYGFSVRCVRD